MTAHLRITKLIQTNKQQFGTIGTRQVTMLLSSHYWLELL